MFEHPKVMQVPQAELKTLLNGLAMGESPRWHNERLWFSDWAAHEIVAVDLAGNREVMVRLPFSSFQATCFDWLPDGRLLVVSSGSGRLLHMTPVGMLATYADLSGFAARGWNEIVVDGHGSAYVNGGGFDLAAGEKFAPGMIVLVTQDGFARQVADDIAFPNGMAVTADNSTLIIAESYGKRLTAFDILGDGSL